MWSILIIQVVWKSLEKISKKVQHIKMIKLLKNESFVISSLQTTWMKSSVFEKKKSKKKKKKLDKVINI